MDPYAHHRVTLNYDDPRIDEPEYIDLDSAAKRMGLSVKQVMTLIRMGALRYEMVGGQCWVRPAILTGAVPE